MADSAGLADWDDLRFFLAVVRGGSLARAAETTGADASTVHRRIRQMEVDLDTQIFDRAGRGYALTAAGEALHARAARIESEVIGIQREVAGQDQSLSGDIRVTTTDTMAEYLLGPILHAFGQTHPAVRVELLVDKRTYRLGRGEADVAIRSGAAPTEDDVVVRRLSGLRWALYGACQYLEDKPEPRPANLAELDFIGVDESLAHIAYAEWLRTRYPSARVAMRVSMVTALASAARHGIGVAALPCFVGDSIPVLRRLVDPVPEMDSDLWLIVHRDLRHVARIRAFVDFFSERLTALAPVIEGRAADASSG